MPKSRRHYRVKLADVLEAHESALRYGGRDGIRDLSLIQSAIGRPYVGYYRPIHRKAAAITESLVRNHGFVDGNKRTTLLTAFLFVERSGYELTAPPGLSINRDMESLILNVANGRMNFDEIAQWYKVRLKRKD